MLAGIFHQGSGLGDQLHRYITVRTLAEKKHYDWGMVNPENFKGASFMKLYTGSIVSPTKTMTLFLEKDVRDAHGIDIRSYDPEINFVMDDTILDGGFEDSKYWGNNLQNIDRWLHVEPLPVPQKTCVIGFRGGEYATDTNLFLPKEYWNEGVARMKALGVTDFEVHTDDEALAQQFFPDFPCVHEIGYNWRSMRSAKYALIANSAFYIMPRLLRNHAHELSTVTIAPRFWARHNLGIWARPACYYDAFTYI